MERVLFSEVYTEEDCFNMDCGAVIYNLYEDIQCLKEKIEELEANNNDS